MQDVETKAQRKCKEGNTADCTLDKQEAEGGEIAGRATKAERDGKGRT